MPRRDAERVREGNDSGTIALEEARDVDTKVACFDCIER